MNKVVNWIISKAKQSEVCFDVKVFKGRLPGRMISELHRLAREDKKCRAGCTEFPYTYEGINYHVFCRLPSYKGQSFCNITFHIKFDTEAQYLEAQAKFKN